MPYTATSWTSGTTPVDAPEMNNLETQYTEAINSIHQDLFTPFVLSGLVATKDGTTATQLDVTAGVAWLKQTDNSLRRRAPNASTQSTVGHPSATMYLFLNVDGTFTWGTSSTGPTNSLAIAHCTTDASANILVVTDDRVLSTSFLPNATGIISLPTFRNGAFVLAAIMTGSAFPPVAPVGSVFVKA